MNDKKIPALKVLMVDDNKLVRSLMREILESEEDIIVTAEAESSQQAKERLHQGNVDVVIMDISLKDGVGGLAFLKEMRQQGSKIPFIMVSAHDEELYARTSLQANAQGYICKGKLVSCLVTAVREVAKGGTFTSNNHMG